jgi:hypothetical protein
MNPMVSQHLVQAHQAQLLAESAAARLAASGKRTAGQAGRTTGTSRFIAALTRLIGVAAHSPTTTPERESETPRCSTPQRRPA